MVIKIFDLLLDAARAKGSHVLVYSLEKLDLALMVVCAFYMRYRSCSIEEALSSSGFPRHLDLNMAILDRLAEWEHHLFGTRFVDRSRNPDSYWISESLGYLRSKQQQQIDDDDPPFQEEEDDANLC